jgi:hypothetical protein
MTSETTARSVIFGSSSLMNTSYKEDRIIQGQTMLPEDFDSGCQRFGWLYGVPQGDEASELD